MKSVETLTIQYSGFSEPTTILELEFEQAGLELALCEIQVRLAKLRQAQKLLAILEANDGAEQTGGRTT